MRVEAANRERARIGPGGGPPSGRAQAGGSGFWRSRRASPFSAGRLAAARLGNGWRLLVGVGVGMLVAVVLICTVPLYDSLMTNVQLQATIGGQSAAAVNVEVVATSSAFTDQVRRREDAVVRADGGKYLSAFARAGVTTYLSTDPMLLGAVGTRPIDVGGTNAPQVTFEAFDYAAAKDHMRLIAGDVPQAGQAPGGGGVVDALITKQLADQQGVKIGDVLKSLEFGAHDRQIAARVVGVWQPVRADDPFWNGHSFDAGGSDTSAQNYPVLLAQSGLLAGVQAIPDLAVAQHWIYYTDAARITTDNMGDVQSNIGFMRSHTLADLATLGAETSVNTSLDHTIQDVRQQLSLLSLPLYIVVAQVVGLALLFVLAMAGLLVEGQTGDIATLKSRGASGVQLLGSYATQGLLLGIVAAGIGPLLAGALALLLVRTFVPAATLSAAGASSSYLVGLARPQAVVLPAAAGALLGLGAVVAATQRAARLDVLAFRREQGRSTRQPLWRRYYLDVGLAVLCALGYLELSQFGGLGTRVQLGQAGSSLLLLAAPALLLLAGTLLLLRVFPMVADAGARWASRGRGATGMLAFAQVARSPAGPSRLMLLLALAVGLGLFALTFDSSLVRSAADRAAYQAGADVRLVEQGPLAASQTNSVLAQVSTLPGVQGVTPVYRSDASTTFDEGYNPVNMLGIDPATWQGAAGVTSWRSDYASVPLASLMAGMKQHQWGDASRDAAGQSLAGDASHPIWAMVSATFATAQHLQPGDRFALNLPGASSTSSFFVVGAIVHEFPTLFPTKATGGFLVADLYDVAGAQQVASKAANQGPAPATGPNELWLKTSDDAAARAALTRALGERAAALNLDRTVDRRALQASIASNPIQSGMRGLLLVGALTAAGLAVLGTIVQSALAARQRVVQFAVLRTMGMASRQLTGLLLGEQVTVYVFGLLGGSLLGAVLTTATLPFLQFSDGTVDPATVGVPPYVLTIAPANLAWFYAALLAAFVVALAVAARFAASVGLGKTLRLGED
jgi:ABC-type lipoprotein release transport system permease subunit